LGCLAAAGNVLAQKVKIELDPEADFSHVRSYEWRKHPMFEKDPELQTRYATAIQLVLQAGNEQLRKRGLHPADHSPDVFVTFFVSATDREHERTVLEPAGPWWGSPYGWYGSPTWTTTEIEYYTDGMLVIDVVDAHTSRLLWRAFCSDTIKDFRERDKNINATVKKAFQNFPPKTK